METKLGIIIPTYNSLETLKVLVKNIFDYTDGDYTVYIIEDGQREETIEWLKTQNVKTILHETNKGVAISWNDGLKEAIKNACTHFAIFNDDIEVSDGWWRECLGLFGGNVHLVTVPCKGFTAIIAGWFFIIDKHCLDEVGYFDEQFSPCFFEDIDYGHRYQLKGFISAYTKTNVFHHGGITTYGTLKKSSQEAFNENFRRFRKKYPNIKIKEL